MRIAFLIATLALLFVLSGCLSGSPVPPIACVEKWQCSQWTLCVGGMQTRSCIETNACGTNELKPLTQQSCEPSMPETPVCGDAWCTGNETCDTCSNDCGACPVPPESVIDVQVGAVEKIFDSSTQGCDDSGTEGPDLPVHALRNADGEIILYAGNAPDNYVMAGTNFSNLRRDCSAPALVSPDKHNVTDFGAQQWLFSPYTLDGETVYALVNNEYHDPVAPNCNPGDTHPSNLCWWNFLTLAKSTDGGHTFTQPNGASKLVAVLPTKWNAGAPGSPIVSASGQTTPAPRPDPHGYFGPSNIIRGPGDYYYAFPYATYYSNTRDRGSCVMRTKTVNDAHSWKIWDGEGFTIPYLNPYQQTPADPTDYHCAFVSHNILFDNGIFSVTYNTYLEKYVGIVGAIAVQYEGKERCGIWYTLSDNLTEWGSLRLLMETQSLYPGCENNPIRAGYPSMIDHDAPGYNFETSDQTFYLYTVRDQASPPAFSILERRKITLTKE